jgi:hypothetical protein
MKHITYTRCTTYKEAALILMTHSRARLLTWEHSQANTGFIVATEDEHENSI